MSQNANPERAAAAVWKGAPKDGAGAISTQSGLLSDAPYSLVTRFENGKGTTPEELIAAVQAGWFGVVAAELRTITVTLEKFGGGGPLEQTA